MRHDCSIVGWVALLACATWTACSSGVTTNPRPAPTGGQIGQTAGTSGSRGPLAPSSAGGEAGGAGATSASRLNDPVSGDCGLEAAAFCETFEGPDMPGGRGGPLDERVWSVSRFGLASPVTIFSRLAASSRDAEGNAENVPTFCGQTFSGVLPPDDIKLCADEKGSRRLEEVLNDAGNFGFTSMRIRQPFDFTGRTGAITFEVDAKRNIAWDGHGWWTEIWISKDPLPMPYHGAPTVESYVTDAVGFQIAPLTADCFKNAACNQVGRVIVAKDYKLAHDMATQETVSIKTADGQPNRFKLLLSQDTAEFWASDYDKPGELRRVAVVKELGLRFSVGYVHIQHAQYNALKALASRSQTFRWDNIGFDGPRHPLPRAYEIDDDGKSEYAGERQVGYPLSKTVAVSFKNVDLSEARQATFSLNVHGAGNTTLRYRFNGRDWHTFTTPSELDSAVVLRSFAIPVPIAELVTGTNKVELTQPTQDPPIEFVGNMDLTLDAP